MTSLTQLHRRYDAHFVHLAGEDLLPLKDAIRFVQDCKDFSVAIVGIEFFERVGEGIMPVGLADFSSVARSVDCVDVTTESALVVLADRSAEETLVVLTLKDATSIA